MGKGVSIWHAATLLLVFAVLGAVAGFALRPAVDARGSSSGTALATPKNIASGVRSPSRPGPESSATPRQEVSPLEVAIAVADPPAHVEPRTPGQPEGTAASFAHQPPAPDPVRDPTSRDARGILPALVAPTGQAITLRSDRISIQTALTEICRQAGLTHDWRRSYEGTRPACQTYISIDLAGATLGHALQEVVVKHGLKVRVEGNKVWLEK